MLVDKDDCVKFKDKVCFFINTIDKHKILFDRYFMLNYEKYIKIIERNVRLHENKKI